MDLYTFFIGSIAIYSMIETSTSQSSKLVRERMDKNYSTEISGIVSHIREYRGLVTLKLKGKADCPYYLNGTRNRNLSPSEIDEFAKQGDSIYKAPNSNELFVFKSGSKYRFVLDD